MSLINLIVKTLDGRNHDFTVLDNITVLQFKSIINEKMDIAVDRQRLLFQGRVLQDDNLLSSYNVAGNVMHLVTRPPPSQNRPQTEPTIEREENSDINRDQIRNILSDVFGNIADLSNPLGVSVNNEGNRVDITVNMPSTNRLSLARLRQNYIHRLMNQARELIQNLRDPNYPAPRPDRDRLYQANAYDLGQNEERITEVTAQPLPIHNLADMVHSVRDLWREAEPQLELWENVLRRQNLPEQIASSDREMQHLHDSASRYIHLFSHMLHIMSDYLVEFQQNSNSRIAVPRNVADTVAPTTEAATSTSIDDNVPPLTGGFGESAMPPSDSNSTSDTNASAADSSTDRSRYLYVFSEMPAQLLQVRLDVDSTIQMPAHGPSPGLPVHRSQVPRSTESRTAQVPTEIPAHATTEPAAVPPNTDATSARPRRRENQFSVPSMENLFRTTIQDSFVNPSPRMNGASPRSIRSGSQLIENVDPYVRCQSRHFQNPSSLRSGAVLSTFGGIRLRESSRTRARPVEVPPVSSDNTNTTATSTTGNATTETRDAGDPFRSFIGGLINSIFSTSGDSNTTTIVNEITTIPPTNISTTSTVASTVTRPTETSSLQSPTSTVQSNDITGFLQSMVNAGAGRLDAPLGQLFPEILSGHDTDIENNITNKIIQLVVNQLTMIDFTQIIHGSYQPLNTLRIPLQALLQRHQQECAGSRDRMLEHVVADLEFFNRVYMSIFDRLRGTESVAGLSDEARNHFNTRIDIPRTINNLNRHHARVVVDMILRSPTDIGFGQLLMNSMFSHHEESLALLDIICNNNDELRQYMVRAFFECLVSSMDESPDNLSQFLNQSRNTFGLDWIFGNVNSRLFRRPEQLSQLREIVLASYVVFSDTTEESLSSSGNTGDHVMANSDCLEEMVNSLSGNIATVLPPDADVMMDIATSAHTANGGSAATWQAVLPHDWLDIVARDANAPVEQHTIGIPYSDAYVSGMPPKRRKVILNQRHRAVQPVPEMMHDCIDQAVRAAGITSDSIQHQNMGPFSAGLNASFQDIVADHVRNRLVDESFNFPADRFPTVEQNFQRKKRSEEDKKNN